MLTSGYIKEQITHKSGISITLTQWEFIVKLVNRVYIQNFVHNILINYNNNDFYFRQTSIYNIQMIKRHIIIKH